MQQNAGMVKVNAKIERIELQFATSEEERKELLAQKFISPKRMCRFCGRITNHSVNGKVCLVCGLINEIH